jgi:hypothetical protein
MHEDVKALCDTKQSKSYEEVSPIYQENFSHAQRIWIELGCSMQELILNRKSEVSKVMIVVLNI